MSLKMVKQEPSDASLHKSNKGADKVSRSNFTEPRSSWTHKTINNGLVKKEVTTLQWERIAAFKIPHLPPAKTTALKMALNIPGADVSLEGEIMELPKNCGCQVWPLWRLPERLVQELVFVLTSFGVFPPLSCLEERHLIKNLKAQELTRKAWGNRQYLGQEVDKWRSRKGEGYEKEIYYGRKNFKSSTCTGEIRNMQTS